VFAASVARADRFSVSPATSVRLPGVTVTAATTRAPVESPLTAGDGPAEESLHAAVRRLTIAAASATRPRVLHGEIRVPCIVCLVNCAGTRRAVRQSPTSFRRTRAEACSVRGFQSQLREGKFPPSTQRELMSLPHEYEPRSLRRTAYSRIRLDTTAYR